MKHHPWVNDVEEEIKQRNQEMKEESDYDGLLEE